MIYALKIFILFLIQMLFLEQQLLLWKLEGYPTFQDKAKQQPKSTFAKAWQFMQENAAEVMVNGNKEGVDKAEKGNYAFFMESSSIKYETERKCNLTMVNGLLDEKGYGIAMRKNSTYRNSLSTGILKLQNSGKIAELERKWWQEKKGGGNCAGEVVDEAAPLDLKNVSGVFGVTIGGTVFAIFLAIIETLIYTAKKSAKSKISFKDALKEEIKFYFKFGQMVKPVVYVNASEEGSSTKFQSQEKELPYDLVNQLPSIETPQSNSNSSKSRKSKKKQRMYNKENSVNTC